eukprot:TRINITY_DN5233_c0_g1_i1.p1 TRINITY_DN5233_c0_g1~~TRINITY_DN5233_c0_g1_i1.p1  ORF type:complete len:573 (-),score=76.68 TRINITY_DN5233_c0_g1_i1:44-1723(-)
MPGSVDENLWLESPAAAVAPAHANAGAATVAVPAAVSVRNSAACSVPTVRQLRAAFVEGRTTADKSVMASLERVWAAPKAINNAFVKVFFPSQEERDRGEPHVLMQARAADAQREAGLAAGIQLGGWLGPLAGVPVAVKDVLDVAGTSTASGNPKAFGDHVALRDAKAVERLKAAGALFVGKLHTTELMYSNLGYNPHYHTPFSPFGLRGADGRLAGGSSSGSAVAVAAGLIPASVGTDNGGSVRLPAAWCGVTGFSPTSGKVPMEGCQALCENFDRIGPVGNCVDDCLILYRVMAGHPDPLSALPTPEPKALRLMMPSLDDFGDLDSAVTAAFEAALSALRAAGASIDRVSLPFLARLQAPYHLAADAEAATTFASLLGDTARSSSLDNLVRVQLQRGAQTTATAYLQAHSELRRLRAAMDDVTAGYDAVVMPTVPITPPLLSTVLGNEELMASTASLCGRMCRIANALDRCAVTVPCHPPPVGEETVLPVGFMVVGRNGGDEACLSIAAAVEAVLRAASLGMWRPAMQFKEPPRPAPRRRSASRSRRRRRREADGKR